MIHTIVQCKVLPESKQWASSVLNNNKNSLIRLFIDEQEYYTLPWKLCSNLKLLIVFVRKMLLAKHFYQQSLE